MRICVVLAFSLWIVVLAVAQSYRPKEGYVPDSATAVKIAEAVLVPIYGKKQIESEQPFTAKLKDDVWTVSGTLRCPDGKGGMTTQCDGGVAVVQISKVDAHVISMTHYK
jgi:NTF2 fold immunity protein of polymorphic toxin system component